MCLHPGASEGSGATFVTSSGVAPHCAPAPCRGSAGGLGGANPHWLSWVTVNRTSVSPSVKGDASHGCITGSRRGRGSRGDAMGLVLYLRRPHPHENAETPTLRLPPSLWPWGEKRNEKCSYWQERS